jgi:hypothetical protein
MVRPHRFYRAASSPAPGGPDEITLVVVIRVG